MEKRRVLAIVGLVVTVPALLMCLLGPLGLEPPRILTHPVVILGGLALALAMNTLSVAHVDGQNYIDVLVWPCLRTKKRIDGPTAIEPHLDPSPLE